MRIDINLATHLLAMLNLTSIQETLLPSVNPDINSPLTDSAGLNQSNSTPFQEILGKTLAEDLKTELNADITGTETAILNELLTETTSAVEIPISLMAEASTTNSNPMASFSLADSSNILRGAQNQINPSLLNTIEENVLQTTPLLDTVLENADGPLATLIGDNLKTTFSTSSASNQNYTTFLQAQAYQNNSIPGINTSPYSALNQFTQLLTRDALSEEVDINSVNFAEIGKILPISPDSSLVAQSNLITQTASPSSSAPLLPIHPHHVATEFGKPAWGNDFNQQITWLATQKHQIAELHLHPAELGPVEVILHISNDQSTQVSAQFTSPHLAVREAIESALPRLREMMAENGITLGNTTVGAETSQQHANQQHGSIASNANENSTTAVATIQGLSTEFNGSALPRHQGIINTFA